MGEGKLLFLTTQEPPVDIHPVKNQSPCVIDNDRNVLYSSRSENRKKVKSAEENSYFLSMYLARTIGGKGERKAAWGGKKYNSETPQ